MRRAAKVDGTHAQIRETLRARGFLVQDCHGIPNWCDMIAFQPSTGRYLLVEAKTPKGKLRPSQERLRAEGWAVTVIRSADEAARV